MDLTAAGVDLNDSDGRAVAMSFPVNDSPASSSPPKLPRRLRRRLLLSESSRTPSTAETIDAKLRDADLRRQQFYEFLSSKARPKPRSPTWSSSPQDEELSQRIEARLNAAEQKRLGILAKAQLRLSRLDELRQAAKSGVELRFEKLRDQLGVKLESRVQQAEANRLHILKTHRQLRAARRERTAKSLMRKMTQESKYKDRVQAAINQKRAAAERKRLGLLEAERSKARARLLQVQRAANSIYTQREIERMRKKDRLEDRLQRAKRQRAEHIKQRKSSQGSPFGYLQKQAELLAIKLARCWRQFVKSKGTTYSLAKAYVVLNINEKSIASMPFEQLALRIESNTAILSLKSLLDRFKNWLTVQHASRNGNSSGLENIDHLLKRVASPNRREVTKHPSRSSGVKKLSPIKKGAKSKHRISRYPVRVALCAYMILGHPNAVLSGKGEQENTLANSATMFIREMEVLIRIIVEGRDVALHCGNSFFSGHIVAFRSQLEAFDKAWCSYLYHFVVWKIKDAKLLEEDLVMAACQLELSMMRTCKLIPEGDQGELTHDMKAIQKQVLEDQRLLKENVQNLSGEVGIKRMEHALSDARSKFFATKDYVSPLTSTIVHISSPSPSLSENGSPVSISDNQRNWAFESGHFSRIARSMFREDDPHEREKYGSPSSSGEDGKRSISSVMITENELLVNEIVHGHSDDIANSLWDEEHYSLKAKVRETMEKAFWNGIMDSVSGQQPDFSWVLRLITEVRDELCEMSPINWRQDIIDAIDIDILSQVLATGILDMIHLGKILGFVLVTLQKLSAPANEEEMKAKHETLMKELNEISQSSDNSSFVKALIKGLHYVLQQIQILKREISIVRIGIMAPLIKGPAGFDYLQKAFSAHYGLPADAAFSLPLTLRWLSSTKTDAEDEWREFIDSMYSVELHPLGHPPLTLRTGGSVPGMSMHSNVSVKSGNEEAECKGEKLDLLIRLGLLKLVSQIEGLTPETLPETMNLNFSRLRAVQSQVQKMIVVSTSMLVLRQILVSEKLVVNASDLETILSQSTKQLSELVDGQADIGLSHIVEATINIPDSGRLVVSLEKLQARKEVVASMIAKSVKAGDTIFTCVSHAIYLAMRAAVLGGTGSKGRQLAEMVLRRVMATLLTDKVMDAAQPLSVMAAVSGCVHRPWYDKLLTGE